MKERHDLRGAETQIHKQRELVDLPGHDIFYCERGLGCRMQDAGCNVLNCWTLVIHIIPVMDQGEW